MQSVEEQIKSDEEKVEETEMKIVKMEDAGILPRDGFAGTLNIRCREVRKEQESVGKAIAEVKPKYE